MKIINNVFFGVLAMSFFVGGALINSNNNKFDSEINLKALGVKIMVTDLKNAEEFYVKKLGFKINNESKIKDAIELKDKRSKLLLVKTKNKNVVESSNEAQSILVIQVNNLEETMKRWKEKGVEFTTGIRKVGVGISAKIQDPFGNSLSVLQQTIVETPQFEEPQIYNYGYYFADIASAKKLFSETLQFKIRTEKYFPPSLPLANWNNTFGFMLHEKQDLKKSDADYYNDTQTIMVFGCSDIQKTLGFFKEAGVNVLFDKPKESELGKYFAFDAGEGVVSEVVELN